VTGVEEGGQESVGLARSPNPGPSVLIYRYSKQKGIDLIVGATPTM